MSAVITPSFTAGRDASGRWTGGNPGRPRGSRNKVSKDALAAVKALSDDAIEVVKARLAAGDLRAAEFVLSHVLPKGARTVELDAPDAGAIAIALAEGEITPDEAAQVAATLARLADIEAVAELAARLDELEQAVAAGRK